MEERRKEHERTEGTDNNRFSNSRLNKKRKRGKKNRVTYSSCLHDQQTRFVLAQVTSTGKYLRHTSASEEPQEPQPAGPAAELTLKCSSS